MGVVVQLIYSKCVDLAMDTSLTILPLPDTTDHKEYHQILWNGKHLDGTLTVVYCAKCNADYPSEIPGRIIVDFTLISDITFVGTAAITPNKDGVLLLLEVITESYGKYVLDYRKEKSCTLQ